MFHSDILLEMSYWNPPGIPQESSSIKLNCNRDSLNTSSKNSSKSFFKFSKNSYRKPPMHFFPKWFTSFRKTSKSMYIEHFLWNFSEILPDSFGNATKHSFKKFSKDSLCKHPMHFLRSISMDFYQLILELLPKIFDEFL